MPLIAPSGNPARAAKPAPSPCPGPAVFTKTISLPSNLAESDVESQVQIEANQYVPYPLDEVSLDFDILGPSARNPDHDGYFAGRQQKRKH